MPGHPQYGPQYGPPPGYGDAQGFVGVPPVRRRGSWLLAGAIALVVVLIGGAGVLVASRGSGDDAAAPAPTGSYTDGLSSAEPTPTPTPSDEPTAATEPTEPPSEPLPSPTPSEKRRTVKDVDKGLEVYDDVYVELAKGWRKLHTTKYSVTLGAEGRGVAYVVVSPVGYPAASAVPAMVGMVKRADKLTGVQNGKVTTLKPANSNIGSQARLSFTGRFTQNGATVSVAGRCTTMTGVESIHNVTVAVCVEARKDDTAAAYRDAGRMLASVARSI